MNLYYIFPDELQYVDGKAGWVTVDYRDYRNKHIKYQREYRRFGKIIYIFFKKKQIIIMGNKKQMSKIFIWLEKDYNT